MNTGRDETNCGIPHWSAEKKNRFFTNLEQLASITSQSMHDLSIDPIEIAKWLPGAVCLIPNSNKVTNKAEPTMIWQLYFKPLEKDAVTKVVSSVVDGTANVKEAAIILVNLARKASKRNFPVLELLPYESDHLIGFVWEALLLELINEFSFQFSHQ